ncbi:DUF547 domain-containing protein [Croceiramulus getboli]|nr:DUF547 domain-containing protein [Flavobacteriaceae bacterium YJPT1-3]
MKKITMLFIILLSLSLQSCSLLAAAGLSSQGQPTKEVTGDLSSITEQSSASLDHSNWDALLKKHVNQEGLVDYQGFQDDRQSLENYLTYLSGQQPDDSWSIQELLAYYINLYNAYTVELILDNYPTQSIKDIEGAWTKAIVPVGDRTLSLGGIENGVLRKMNEPRIHFAINCASISCPKLLREAYTASGIEEQLERATREFINSDKNEISAQDPKVSSLFDWYRKDYLVRGNSSVIEFINTYSNTKINPGVELNYLDYNWGLNAQN